MQILHQIRRLMRLDSLISALPARTAWKVILASLLFHKFLMNDVCAQLDSIKTDDVIACPGPIDIRDLPLQVISTPIIQIGPVDTLRFRRGDDHSIEYGLNTVPGIRYESRGPGGSRRVSMRGSLLRSGFGVRGVKAYVDGVPLTSPDGNTPLEVLDVAAIKNVQVMMGPHCTQFGPGTGGVLLFDTADPAHLGRVGGTVSVGGGSFGYQRASIGLTLNAKRNSRFSTFYVRERFVGYRAQEGNYKDFVLLKGSKQFQPGLNPVDLSTSVWYYDGGWELPGGLDSLTNADAPRSANLYSQQQAKAAVQRKWLQGNVGLSVYRPNFEIHSRIYGQATHKLNPYGTSAFSNGYKDETGSSWGTRTVISYPRYAKSHLVMILEGQLEPARLAEYDNVQGQPGALRIDQQVTARQGLISLGASHLFRHCQLNGFFSINYLGTNFRDLSQAAPTSTIATPLVPQGSVEARFLAKSAPIQRFRPTMSYYLRAATAYSPPNWWELRQVDGSLDQSLNPEQGINLEAGLQGSFSGDPRNMVIFKVYHLALWDAILPYTDTLGLTRYRNAEQCNQTGAELSFHFNLTKAWFLQGSAAWMHYRFAEASAMGDFERGDAVPGVPTATAFLATEYALPFHLLLRVSGHFTGPIWLDSHNSDRQDAYAVVNAFVEQTLTRKRGGLYEDRASLRLTVGVNNLLNAAYSNYLNLNDRRRNYWNPAPMRNIFAGIQCTF